MGRQRSGSHVLAAVPVCPLRATPAVAPREHLPLLFIAVGVIRLGLEVVRRALPYLQLFQCQELPDGVKN